MKIAIFYEFIKKLINNSSFKNGEKQNCVYAEALCSTAIVHIVLPNHM